MVNQLGKLSPRISELTQPLRELLSSKRNWTWGSSQEEAFALVKTELTKPILYSSYSAGTSSYSIQAILLLQVDDTWKPLAYTCNKVSDCSLIPDRLVPLPQSAQYDKDCLYNIVCACVMKMIWLVLQS